MYLIKFFNFLLQNSHFKHLCADGDDVILRANFWVEIGRIFLALFNSLRYFVFSSAAMLDFEKCNSWVVWSVTS